MDGLKVLETDQERFERQNTQLSKESMLLVSECATMKVKYEQLKNNESAHTTVPFVGVADRLCECFTCPKTMYVPAQVGILKTVAFSIHPLMYCMVVCI